MRLGKLSNKNGWHKNNVKFQKSTLELSGRMTYEKYFTPQ